MCLMVRILYKFNTLEAFERAVRKIESNWKDKLIRGRVIYNSTKIHLNWSNVYTELTAAKAQNPSKIHGLIAVENQ